MVRNNGVVFLRRDYLDDHTAMNLYHLLFVILCVSFLYELYAFTFAPPVGHPREKVYRYSVRRWSDKECDYG